MQINQEELKTRMLEYKKTIPEKDVGKIVLADLFNPIRGHKHYLVVDAIEEPGRFEIRSRVIIEGEVLYTGQVYILENLLNDGLLFNIAWEEEPKNIGRKLSEVQKELKEYYQENPLCVANENYVNRTFINLNKR